MKWIGFNGSNDWNGHRPTPIRGSRSGRKEFTQSSSEATPHGSVFRMVALLRA